MQAFLEITGHLVIQELGDLTVVKLSIMIKEQLGQVLQILEILKQRVLIHSTFKEQVVLELLQTLEHLLLTGTAHSILIVIIQLQILSIVVLGH